VTWYLVAGAVGFFVAGPVWLVIFVLASAERHGDGRRGGYIETGGGKQ
jgi:hypothetical protein